MSSLPDHDSSTKRLWALGIYALTLGAISIGAVAWTSFGSLTAIWPSNALILIALLRGPTDRAWRVSVSVIAFVALTVAILSAGAPLVGAAYLAATNMVEVGCALLLLKAFRLGREDLTRPWVLIGFIVCCAIIAPAAGASLAAPAVASVGRDSLVQAWLDYWAADALGMVIFGSLGLVTTKEHLSRISLPRDWLHAGFLLAALAGGTFLIVQWDARQLALLAPITVWATLRFGPLGASGSVLWTCVVAVALNLLGLGTVGAGDPDIRTELFQLQVGLAVLPLVTLPVAAVLTQRDRAARAAQAADRAKSAFLANMSHEIRTPLNGVVALAGMLAREVTDPRQKEMAETIQTSGQVLERLLADILDIARIEAGAVEIERVPFDPDEILKSTVALLGLQAQEKGIRLTVRTTDCPDGPRLGDALRVRQILNNLISNAIKFTDVGSVDVELVGDPASITIVVRDTGVGFDKDAQDLIFGRFHQADGSITRRFGGSGLGLAISRHLAEVMGGRLDATSTPGVGSTFTAALPLPLVGTHDVNVGRGIDTYDPQVAPQRAGPARALVADDHPTNLKVLELILEAQGVEMVAATNGAEAVEAFMREAFDVVLMDMQMPVMDGLEAIRRIRSHEAENQLLAVPIVMLTANASPEHEDASRLAGSNAFMTKPVSPEMLLMTLSALSADRDALSGGRSIAA
ncbi:MAG TPA: ATP-binding protein [Brevundimonas sp.]|nr:ATP-binding protein [Brevundimonas sp.]